MARAFNGLIFLFHPKALPSLWVGRALLLFLLAAPAAGSGLPIVRPAGEEASHADILGKTEEYISRLQELLQLYEQNEAAAAKLLRQRNELYKGGLISRDLFESNRRAHGEAKARVDDTRALIVSAQKLVAEVQLALEMEKLSTDEPPAKDTVIFFAGTSPWALAEAAKVESYFVSHFGISLPVSAIGQTDLHTRMGFNHREAIDIALHPDSAEGKDLLEYLKSSGYPFVAFRSAIPGSATGAHIHVGHPSARIIASTRSAANQAIKASF